jgi:hypothetical protein
MSFSDPISRRSWLTTSAALAAGSWSASFASHPPAFADDVSTTENKWPSLAGREPKSVAGVLTTYFKGSHSDVLIGRLLEGWKIDGGQGPALKLSSLYIDQQVNTEFGRELAARYNIPVFETIEGAVTAGTNGIAVDGVLSIGEHGSYPRNELGQDLYPRRRFFQEITDTFAKYDKVVPVFNDKHLGPDWVDALWMYERAQQMHVPFMAGSSLVVGYRSPDLTVPLNSDIEAAVAIGYAELDRYGIHTLEFLQCMVEKRRGGEVGVKSVQCLAGDAIWTAVDAGRVHAGVLKAVADVSTKVADTATDSDAQMRASRSPGDVLFLMEYYDGFTAAVFMLSGFARSISAGIKLRGQDPVATQAEERTVPRHPHFAFLLHAVERMIHTGKPTYPVERTLLTTGILDRALRSRSQNGQRLDTPELAIAYQPSDYPHAPNPPLPL